MADPWLLTPGPLTTSASVKQAMLHDWGSRDRAFIEMTARIRKRLVDLVHGGDEMVCVPIQGSGTFAVEAMLGTLVPPDGKLLVLVNGAYGRRMVEIARRQGRAVAALSCAEDQPCDPEALDRALREDPAIGHVAVVQCETTTGILNPLERIAAVTLRHDRRLVVDAMSALGALPLDARKTVFEAVAASSNKCLEGVPGVGFVIVRRDAIRAAAGRCPSLALDLHAQHEALEANGQWRFTPPTHVLAALDRALAEHAEEGGSAGRLGRYRENARVLVEGMRRLGFTTLLPDELQAPIIVTFTMPTDERFVFERFYDGLRERGYVIYPGKLTTAPSFRIGCIGRIGRAELEGAVAAVADVLDVMGVRLARPAA